MWLTVFFCATLLAALLLLGLWALGPWGREMVPEQRALRLAELTVKLAQGQRASGRFTIDWASGLYMLELRDGAVALGRGNDLGLSLWERQLMKDYGQLRQGTLRVVIQTGQEHGTNRRIRELLERHRTAFRSMVCGQRLMESEFGQ